MAMSILGIVTEEARTAGAGAIRSVNLCLGELAGVEVSTLTACFEMLAEGGVADSAKLVIRRIPATGICTVCGAKVARQGRVLRCPDCVAGSIRLTSGRELYVESIEVEPGQQG
jgi:hydrogenase nickel incorporation protein HypA/HybF